MPLPTEMELISVTSDLLQSARQAEHYQGLAKMTTGEVSVAYKVIADDWLFKLRNKINKLWLYSCDDTAEFKL